jgi:hypothetical protein
MQVTPAVAREWAAETGMRELSEQMRRDPASLLRDPETRAYVSNILARYREKKETGP